MVLMAGCTSLVEEDPDAAEAVAGAEVTPDASPDTGEPDVPTEDTATVEDTADSEPDPGPDVPVEEDIPEDVAQDATVGFEQCLPCETDEDCADEEGCLWYPTEGYFCGSSCAAFGCTDETEGDKTICAVENGEGLCLGSRVCIGGELTPCDAPIPAFEACDGLDNDCDGATDDGWPDANNDGVANCIDPDDDGDDVADEADNCPLSPNTDQADLDGDGQGDACDPDIDGDGSPNTLDCAPTNPDQTAPQTEVCNGADDDCDGQTDEANSLGCKIYYPDVDEDGYGADGQGKCLCGPEGDFQTILAGDCDDKSKVVGPIAPEQCDTVDNDCDGELDEEGAAGCKPWFFEIDGDGWYEAGADSKCLCGKNLVNQYTGSLEGDCNDADALVNPGGFEICDGKDDNCDDVADEGCDSDGDGWCDIEAEYEPTTSACPNGPLDCDDSNPQAYPGAPELCDGADNNCDPSDDIVEGTVYACGPSCEPCPDVGPDTPWVCTGAGAGGACELSCPAGKFCDDCSCDGSVIFALGSTISDGKLLYDPVLDTFRAAFFDAGNFKLRKISATGASGEETVAVPGVAKWTRWGVTQNKSDGRFVFAWTLYPKSKLHVGVADVNGNPISSAVVADEEFVPGFARQNVSIGWHDESGTDLLLWDETTSFGRDVRGMLLNAAGQPISAPFGVIGGSGDQFGPDLGLRGGAKGHLFSYATQVGQSSPPKIQFIDHAGDVGSSLTITPSGAPGAIPEIWYDPILQRGVVQWLAVDATYYQHLFQELGFIGTPIDVGVPIAGAFGSPKSGVMRVVFLSANIPRYRTLNINTGLLAPGTTTLSPLPATGIVGTAVHESGYGLVVWNDASGLRGRFIAP